MSGKEFPNNWEVIASAPSEFFQECTYEEFIDWRLCAWEIPGSVDCIIRAQRKDTGEVTEHVYQKPHAAKQRMLRYLQDGEHELTICSADAIHLIKTTDDEPETD